MSGGDHVVRPLFPRRRPRPRPWRLGGGGGGEELCTGGEPRRQLRLQPLAHHQVQAPRRVQGLDLGVQLEIGRYVEMVKKFYEGTRRYFIVHEHSLVIRTGYTSLTRITSTQTCKECSIRPWLFIFPVF